MNPQEKAKILTDYLKLKVEACDWKAVNAVSYDLLKLEFTGPEPLPSQPNLPTIPLAAIPPVEVEIPHHPNEVVSLLRLSDEDLVDKMWPDYSTTEEGA